MILLANNNASSTLAGPIGPSATALAVQSGAGALFPSPGANEYFTVTLNDAATGLLTEIMWCTNVTGDTFTVIRAQEGTAAQNWLANDLVDNFWTAGSMAVMVQQGQLQSTPAPYVNAVPGSYSAVIPAGVTRAKLTIVGGGGAGGGCDGTHNAGGGQAGGILIKWLSGLISGQSITGSIGVGGTPGTAGGTGGTGGTTTAQVNGTGTVYTANGGAGGVGGTTSPFGGFGDGTLSGGDEEYIGSAGGDGDATNVSAPAGNGGAGYLGAGAGKGSAGGGTGANAASATGAGGGGSYFSSSAGGMGGAGLVLLYWST